MANPRQIFYVDPGEIDGDPAAVAEFASKQLVDLALEFSAIIEATVKQVENAGRQRALEDGVEVVEGEANLDLWWRAQNPAQFARAEALRLVADRLPGGARALAYAVSRGE